jgi:hypothetical protein
VIETHWPLALGLVLVAGFGSWVFLHSDRSYLLRWAMIPVSLVVAVASARVYDAGLGYAVAAELPAKFVYLGHHVVVERARKTGIEVWGRSARTRLYRIPYSRPMEQALDRARDQAKGGLPVMMEKHARLSKAMANEAQQDEPPYDAKVLLPSDVNPKVQPASGLARAR